MIRFTDATTLALTKLRTRKIRLLVTILVSGLLFTGLAAASIVARGGFHSIESFGDEGFGKRYIVAANGLVHFDFMQNKEIQDRAAELQKDLVARKTVEAKRLGLTYDPKSEQGPLQEYDMPGGSSSFLDTSHPAAVQAISEYQAEQQKPDLDSLKQASSGYNAINYYQGATLPFGGNTVLKVLKDGKESFEQGDNNMYNMPKGIDSFGQMWQSTSKGLLEPFTLPGESLEKSETGEIPIIIPISAAEELLGMTSLPDTAKSADKLERIKELRARAGSISFEICVRNQASSSLINQAVATQQEIERNKDNRDYVRPSLIYGLPEQACSEAPIIRDVRTPSEKRQAANQEEFDRIFGATTPDQNKFGFKVVGVVPDFSEGAMSTVEQILEGLVMSSLGTGWFTPQEYINERPELQALFDSSNDIYMAGPTYYVEFATPDSARKFLDEQSCNPDFGMEHNEAGSNPFEECYEQDKYFSLYAYGSNSLALDSAKRGFGKGFRYAALGIALIGAIIMMGTVGRMIADSRRETAVFRAIGAKKLDIAQIYVLYTIMLSLLICAFAVIAGMVLAGFVHGRYASDITVEALVAYNAQDLSREFKLYTFYWPDMLQLIGLALMGGVISAVFPLIRNLRRNPIRDMRDDT